jgi:glutathione-independent formaldehyde dehydrogenase
VPLRQIFNKGLAIGAGQCPTNPYNLFPGDENSASRAHPGQIVNHHMPLEAAADASHLFDQRNGEFSKIVLKRKMEPA